MERRTRECKVCGKTYPYCRTYAATSFRWQDVACCPEHGAAYFSMVELARVGSVDDATTRTTDVIPEEAQ